jgi:hypothetical protein
MKSGVTANQLWSQVPLASRTVSLGAGAAGTIKSIQRGTTALQTTALTSDATLSPAVVMANTELRWVGTTLANAEAWNTKHACRVFLQSTTVVRQVRGNGTSVGAYDLTVGWEITEWY